MMHFWCVFASIMQYFFFFCIYDDFFCIFDDKWSLSCIYAFCFASIFFCFASLFLFWSLFCIYAFLFSSMRLFFPFFVNMIFYIEANPFFINMLCFLHFVNMIFCVSNAYWSIADILRRRLILHLCIITHLTVRILSSTHTHIWMKDAVQKIKHAFVWITWNHIIFHHIIFHAFSFFFPMKTNSYLYIITFVSSRLMGHICEIWIIESSHGTSLSIIVTTGTADKRQGSIFLMKTNFKKLSYSFF